MDNKDEYYSARKIVEVCGVNDKTTTYIWRRLLKIPGMDFSKHVKTVIISGPHRRGRPVFDYLLQFKAAGYFALVCSDMRRADKKPKNISENKRAQIIDMIKDCKVSIKDYEPERHSVERDYYELEYIYRRAKIQRQFSTWVGDVVRRNKHASMLRARFDKRNSGFIDFLEGRLDIFVCLKTGKRGRPSIVDAFVCKSIAENEAKRYGVELDDRFCGPAHWCVVKFLDIPRDEVNKIGGRTEWNDKEIKSMGNTAKTDSEESDDDDYGDKDED